MPSKILDKNSASSDKKSRSLRIWCVVPILEVFALGIGANFLKHTTRA